DDKIECSNKEMKMCGTNRCYHPQLQKCFNDNIICKANFELCGSECYNPEYDECWKNKTLVPLNSLMCNEYRPYIPSSEICFNNTTVCPIEYVPCEGVKYPCWHPLATSEQCLLTEKTQLCGETNFTIDKYGPTKLCFANKYICLYGQILCDKKCFRPDQNQTCVNNKIKCTTDEMKLCHNQCYDPKKLSCHNNRTLCKMDQMACGLESYQCYDPTEKLCFNDSHLCLVGQQPCGQHDCYYPLFETCSNLTTVCPLGYQAIPDKKTKSYYSSYLCIHPDSDEICNSAVYGNGATCRFTPDRECDERQCYTRPYNDEGCVCFNKTLTCRNGQQPCGNQCYSSRYGQICIDNSTVKCRDSTNVLCVGTNKCYSPLTSICFNDTGMICPLGSEPCGNQLCFDRQKNETCHHNEEMDTYLVCAQGLVPCNGYCHDPFSEYPCYPSFLNEFAYCPQTYKRCHGTYGRCYYENSQDMCDIGDFWYS
ncbi:unnamed protein product, partial [Didymodactylos carnosus]